MSAVSRRGGARRRTTSFYNAIVAHCPACTVLGAEVLDSTDAPSYLRAMLPGMSRRPAAWGVHNYEDINHFRTTGTDAILSAVPGPIWLTEAGGLVRYVDGSGNITYPYDEQRAARATSFMFDYVDAHVDRVERLVLLRLAQPRGHRHVRHRAAARRRHHPPGLPRGR